MYDIQYEDELEIPFYKEELIKGKKKIRKDKNYNQNEGKSNMNPTKKKSTKVKESQFDKQSEHINLQFQNNQNIETNNLIDDCIDMIRHQQYLLDNINHLDNYNEELLEIWKQQINLLDGFDRFQYYKQLGSMKLILKKLKKILINKTQDHNIWVGGLLNKNNQAFITQFEQLKEILLVELKEENQNQEELLSELFYVKCRITNNQLIKIEDLKFLKKTQQYIDNQVEYQEILMRTFEFVIGQITLKIKKESEQDSQKVWYCELCGMGEIFLQLDNLIKHIYQIHLYFMSRLLLGSTDHCFVSSCKIRRGNNVLGKNQWKEHLKTAHSEIYRADRIFTKLYQQEGCSKAEYHFYGKDAKNWKQKFINDLLEWLEEIDLGSDQYLKDCQMLELRGDRFLNQIRLWMEQDYGLLNSEVLTFYKDFDELCLLLKFSWISNFNRAEMTKSNDVQKNTQENHVLIQYNKLKVQYDWIWTKFNPEPSRIKLIEAISDLLDTKKCLISQLHRYLLLGVFNFKLAQRELNGRLKTLEKITKQLGIFQAVVFNKNTFHNACFFENVMCNIEKSALFQTPLEMLEHYYELHIGVFYAMSDENLRVNLQIEFDSGRINTNNFNELELSELIYYLHDYHDADYKTRSKWYLKECRRNFQMKCVCCDCSRELQTLGDVYWKEQIIRRKGIVLKFNHTCKVSDLIKIYQSGVSFSQDQPQLIINQQSPIQNDGLQNFYSEQSLLEDQCTLYKLGMLAQMKTEIFVDDQGRYSQCKNCKKKLKGFNPILQELREEYFQLPASELYINNDNTSTEVDDKKKLEVKEDDPKFIKTQKEILNRAIDEKAGGSWQALKEQMRSGYFKLDSFPKLVNIYGEISESCDQNPLRKLSQPILTGYMKVVFQTPLIYIPNTSIIYEMQPQWAKLRQQFKLFGSSDLQRKELIQLLETHPVMQNHTYQLTKLTQLCINQVDLIFRLNKHLWKQKKNSKKMNQQRGQSSNEIQERKFEEKIQEEKEDVEDLKLRVELNRTADLLYFEGILHRAQVQFLVQQFKVWQDVFETVQLQMYESIELHLRQLNNNIFLPKLYDRSLLERASLEIYQFATNKNPKWKIFIQMLILSAFYCENSLEQMKLPQDSAIRLQILSQEEEWELLDFIFSKNKENPIRFLVESHLIPILTPLISHYVHPLFLGTLLQIFQLNFKNSVDGEQINEIQNKPSVYSYLDWTYSQLSKLTIKRCIPLYDFNKSTQAKVFSKEAKAKNVQQNNQSVQFLEEVDEQEEQEKSAERKLKEKGRSFLLKMFSVLNENQKVDMQCRYALAKRSLLKVMNSQRENPPIECDLRWAMQIGQMFYSSLRKRASHGNDEEQRVARENMILLKDLKEEADHYFHMHSWSIPEDFLFKNYKKKNGQEITSDLRAILKSILEDDQGSHINQSFNVNPYIFINKLKIAYFIPMEKKLQDVVACVGKLRSLPHKQVYRSMEKFHRYNFRELELLAFPELFATGQGFQQYCSPKIERSSIIVEMSKKEKEQAGNIIQNLKPFKQQQQQLMQEDQEEDQRRQKIKSNKLFIEAVLSDFTTQYRKGQNVPIPKKAILQLKQEEFIQQELACAYVYDLQKISVIKVFQEASENQGVKEKQFNLEQEIEIKIIGEEVLHESLKNDHVQKNFRKLLKKQQNWSNECQSFVKRIAEEIKQKTNTPNCQHELNSNLLEYIRQQEYIFLEQKKQELAQEFNQIDLSDLDNLRQKQVIELKKTKIKKSKQGKKTNAQNSISDIAEEIHSEIMSSLYPQEEMAEKIKEKLITYSKDFTSIGEDTKYRLLNKNTRVFNHRYSFIFWRYSQRLIQRIFSFFIVVNGINFYEQQNKQESNSENDQKQVNEFQKLPPIKGSSTYFKRKYKEQRAVCFSKNTPYLFLTYTFYEFEPKIYQVVQGLNYFDLENVQLLKMRQKKLDKRKLNLLQKQLTIYFHLLCKIVTQCIMNSTVKLNKGSNLFRLHDFGMYGPCIGYTNRFEFQQRGTIHLHQLLYFQKDQTGYLPPKLLEYWASIFSLWNYNLQRRKDKEFIEKRRLEHVCKEDCQREDTGDCIKGFPFKLKPRAYWKSGRKNLIFSRVNEELEGRIFMHDRDVVKTFKSSCIVEPCGSDKVVSYITKYLHKSQKTTDEIEKQNEQIIGGEKGINNIDTQQQDLGEEKMAIATIQEDLEGKKVEDDQTLKSYKQQATNLIHQVLSKKITSLSEALADLLDYPLFQTSFTFIKIAQVPLSDQFKTNMKTINNDFDVENPESDLKTQFRQSVWIKYLSRPNELENLCMMEYIQHFVWYGNKFKYKTKYENQNMEKQLYMIDRNGQIIKERERGFDVIVHLSDVYYIEDKHYENNLYYLAMLQLFWPHRQESWLRETSDSVEGFQQAYFHFYTSGFQRKLNYQEGETKYEDKFIIYHSFKEAVDNYNNLTPAQSDFLKSISYQPKKKNKADLDEARKEKLCKQYLTYNLLMRAKNTIIKLNGLIEQEEETFIFSQNVRSILNFLRPDILINFEQKEKIVELEEQLISYINTFNNGMKDIPSNHKLIFEELISLLKSQNFHKLSNSIYRQELSNQTPKNTAEVKRSNIFKRLDASTESKISQREIGLFQHFEDNISFPQHFKTILTRSEMKNLIRPRMNNLLFNNFYPSKELSKLFTNKCNKQQRLAITILLHYLFSSQIADDKDVINEGCLIHGGGGVGKSFIIEFMMNLFEEIGEPFFILCPTQVSVQNILKDRIKYSKNVMTIHSFFQISPFSDIDSSYDHFLAFLRFVKKEHLFENSTSQLYPELQLYNCMNKVEKFTQKLKGVHCIILEEISMMPPKFLTLLDIYLQASLSNNSTFGGIQVFAFGDSFQLQPVTKTPQYYFQSHVFQNNYFSTCLELNIPIRQSEDLGFYNNILQPIRVGKFQNSPSYRNSINLLQMRHLNEKINPIIGLASGLQILVQNLQVDNQITFLYFDNQAVTRQNEIRADQHILYQQLQFPQQQNSEKYRQFINSPSRISFGIKSSKFELLLQNLSEIYEIKEEYFEQEFSASFHFQLLPLTVRNYILQKLLPFVYERTKFNQKKFSQTYPQNIKIFKNAEIIFRQNLNKELRLINGQSAIIKDVKFDLDFKTEDQLVVQNEEKQKILEQFLTNKLVYEVNQMDMCKINLNQDFIQEVKKELEHDDLNNINCFMDGDVLEYEKLGLVQAGIQPRLKELVIQISGSSQDIYLDNLQKYYQQVTVQMPSNQIKGIIREALQLIIKLKDQVNCRNNPSNTLILQNLIYSNKNLMHLLGLNIVSNNINYHLLNRTEFHLKKFLIKLNDEQTPMNISQLPINLGYARTIHTSQGATFENICVSLDAQHLNCPGLLYTALSRVRNLKQLFFQGEFNEEIFLNITPEELRIFFEQNFIQAEEVLNSKFFSNLVDNNVNDFLETLKQIKDSSKLIRSKLLKQLPRRSL